VSVLRWHGDQCSKCGWRLVLALIALFSSTSAWATGPARDDEAHQKETSGDLAGARSLFEQQAAQPGNSGNLQALADFLNRHHDNGRRDAYLKWAAAERDPGRQQSALRQAILIDFEEGNRPDLDSDLAKYKSAGGSDLRTPGSPTPANLYSTITIPGPLSSFARMAALSPDLHPEELLPALARNIVTSGYEASANEFLQQTEYLKLLIRYVGQARELQALANAQGNIVIPQCDSEQAGNVLRALGYRMRGSCGSDIVLETVNPTRAFLTVDSGFPLTQLESDLRTNHPFELPFKPTPVPVLYNAEYWMTALGRRTQPDFLDSFVSDPSLCRLYLGLSHLDRNTREALRKQASAAKLKLYANVLDFYGGMFQIRNGAAVVPGTPKAWASLVGVSPSNPGAFFERLISVDDGWLASYFDSVSRLNDSQVSVYLTQPDRMRHFYEALKGKYTTPGPARPVFRSSTDLLLLTTELRIDANGEPHIPGGIDVWRTLFLKHPHGKYDGKLTRSAQTWKNSDDLMEALFALSRKTADNEPLKIFLALNDVDRGRSHPLSPETTARLINDYRSYGSQYRIFVDAPSLSEKSIATYLDTCAQLSSIHDMQTKADAVGTMEALVELWEILIRQNAIAVPDQDSSFEKVVTSFGKDKGESEVFVAGRAGLDAILSATHPSEGGSRQDRVVALLVGKLRNYNGSVSSPAENFLRIYDAQRLLSVDSLFSLADALTNKTSPDPKVVKTVADQLNRIEETQASRGDLSPQERNSFALGYWSTKHVEAEQKFNLQALLKNPDRKDARAQLAPFLRDSLVGYLYCYYAPNGGQVLLANPQFVRSHDFVGSEGGNTVFWRTTEISGSGWPTSAGGRLSGSLVALPFALAQAEQNFLTPKREQALIWADLVPQMIINVTLTRYRGVTPNQLRWVSLNMERGHDLLALAGLDPKWHDPVMDSLRRRLSPQNVDEVDEALRGGDYARASEHIPPSVFYALSNDEKLAAMPSDSAADELKSLQAEAGAECSPQAIAKAFGTPKPTLMHSYQPDLSYLRTFPALMGFSSRILAETWESNNLSYAALADQAGVPADQLDAYVPDWNRAAIENIFATHLEDWPALIHSLGIMEKSVLQTTSQRAGLAFPGN
jgi:hypothetical protein